MAILVDEAIWDWRGRRWCHLVSDTATDELHDFAHRLGVPYLAFQGDHYDIHTQLRADAISAGARPVAGRELVVALREAGLRRRGPRDPWQWQWRSTVGDRCPMELPEPVGDDVVEVIAQLGSGSSPVEVGRVSRPGESLLVVSTPDRVGVDPGLVPLDQGRSLHRSRGERGTWVEWRSVR